MSYFTFTFRVSPPLNKKASSTTNKVGKLLLNCGYNEGNPSLFTVYYKYNEYTNIKS